MKGTKDFNTNKGITLIALVITIIVMLILVAVTISMAINGGLFEHAGQAVGKTNNALLAEQQLADGGIEVDGEWYESMDEYLATKGNFGETGGDDAPLEEITVTASSMQSDLKQYLGQLVDYGVTYTDVSTYGNGEWEIFYADGEHIYIITRGHLAVGYPSTTGYNGTSDFSADSLSAKYPAVAEGLLNKTYDPAAAGTSEEPHLKHPSTELSMKSTQYLLDSTVWASYADDEDGFASWAIGGPTFELFVKSYNVFYQGSEVTFDVPVSNTTSNLVDASETVPTGTYLNHSGSTSYWLAGPCDLDALYVSGDYRTVLLEASGSQRPFRPVVCLDSDVAITWNSANSEYTLSRVE